MNNSVDRKSEPFYEINVRTDFSGAVLEVKFPETELDRKALYTIQADTPPFLLPFHYRIMDDIVECTYQIGDNSKLLYLCGLRNVHECVEFWTAVLQPLTECDDWFLSPYAFALNTEYLYQSKDGKTIRYVYIPTVKQAYNLSSLHSMVTDLANRNPVTDVNLENKILRAIMDDFRPNSFLQVLREAQSSEHSPTVPVVEATPVPVRVVPTVDEKNNQHSRKPENMPDEQALAFSAEQPNSVELDDGEIKISIGGNKKNNEKSDKRGKPADHKNKDKHTDKKGGLFFGSKKQKPAKEIHLGAGAENSDSGAVERQRLFQSEKKEPQRITPVVIEADEDDGVTQIDYSGSCPRFSLLGAAQMPTVIEVPIVEGQVFTIGRVDIDGRIHSDFEFPKGTKEVSRRHAAIECGRNGGYLIVDLSSSAGTFVNGQRLQPNVPFPLESESRVSFGSAGADYIWKEA